MLKGLKIIAGLTLVFTLLLSLPTGADAHGRRFSGIDPELVVNGEPVAVTKIAADGSWQDVTRIRRQQSTRSPGKTGEKWEADGRTPPSIPKKQGAPVSRPKSERR